MKTPLLTLIFSSLLIFGCKKSEDFFARAQDHNHNVSFSVSNFSVKTDDPTIGADSVKNFEYYIYTNEGTRIPATDKKIINLGRSVEIKEKLAPGSYKIVFFSADRPIDRHISDQPGEVPGFIYANIFNVYHKAIDITVGPDKVKESVVLDKLNSTLEIDLFDQVIPDNVSSLLITWYDHKYVDFYGTSFTPTRKQKSLKINREHEQRKIEKFSASLFNTAAPITIYITYLDSDGNYVNGREIEEVKCFKNQRTTISGYLFNPNSPELQATVKSETDILNGA